MNPSAHSDTFARDNLPPSSQWPELVFDRPELRYPARLNAAVANGPITYELDGLQYVLVGAGDTLWTFVMNERK